MGFFDKPKNKLKNFEKVTEGMTKEEIRSAEEHLLKPAPISKYSGEKPTGRSELSKRTALIVFKDKEQQDLISELFSIKESINNEIYITDISLLEAIAKGVKEGKYKIVDKEIQVVEETKTCHPKYWPENEEGTIKVHLPDPIFEPLTDEQISTLSKKKLRKYNRILENQNGKAMEKFRAKHFPVRRQRRKL